MVAQDILMAGNIMMAGRFNSMKMKNPTHKMCFLAPPVPRIFLVVLSGKLLMSNTCSTNPPLLGVTSHTTKPRAPGRLAIQVWLPCLARMMVPQGVRQNARKIKKTWCGLRSWSKCQMLGRRRREHSVVSTIQLSFAWGRN